MLKKNTISRLDETLKGQLVFLEIQVYSIIGLTL